MSKQNDSIKDVKEETTAAVPHIKSSIIWVLLTVAFLTLIFGFFIVLSVIINSIQHSQLNYPDAVIIGFLLMIGGLVLLSGTIIMKNWAPRPQTDTIDEASDIKR